ncbi:MAG: hypothetical protein NVSMB9_02150 [Isosphaeraceae bacterium]
MRRPAVFLLDEPLSSLDAPLRATIRDDLIGLHQQLGATMIYVTHDQEEALSLGDRVGVLERGRVIQVGQPREIYEQPATQFVAKFFGSPAMNLLPCTVLEGEGAVRAGLESLEDELSFIVPGVSGVTALAAMRGKKVTLGLRPEHLAIVKAGCFEDPAFTWLPVDARVSRVEYLGPEIVVSLDLFQHTLTTRLPPRSQVRRGEIFRLGLSLERSSWFDPNTKKSLALDLSR